MNNHYTIWSFNPETRVTFGVIIASCFQPRPDPAFTVNLLYHKELIFSPLFLAARACLYTFLWHYQDQLPRHSEMFTDTTIIPGAFTEEEWESNRLMELGPGKSSQDKLKYISKLCLDYGNVIRTAGEALKQLELARALLDTLESPFLWENVIERAYGGVMDVLGDGAHREIKASMVFLMPMIDGRLFDFEKAQMEAKNELALVCLHRQPTKLTPWNANCPYQTMYYIPARDLTNKC